MRKTLFTTFAVLTVFISGIAAPARAFAADTSFRNIEMLSTDGGRIVERSVRVEFREQSMAVIGINGGAVLKEMRYADIVSAEYSYTKNPRWKTGIGLGAAAFVFPPLFLVAIPVGFTKHRRHWVTVRTGDDFVVLKVGKGVRKMFMPAFETFSSVKISALGDNK
jgi:hypothetical protein